MLVFFWDPEKCDANEDLRKKAGEKTKKSTRRMIPAFEVLSTFAGFLFFAALCLVSGIFFFVKPFIKRFGETRLHLFGDV